MSNRSVMPRRVYSCAALHRVRVGGVISALLLATACASDGVTSSAPQPPKGIVVLDGYIQPGLTLLGDTGTTSTRVAMGTAAEFDGSGFSLTRDTVVAASSKGAGDLLFIADLTTRTVRRVQMPVRSNPAGARLLTGSAGQSLIGVPLRDSSAVVLVALAGSGTPSITRLANAGRCPTDVFQYDNATWVVDANADCRGLYTIQGDVRLIRIPSTGTTRDTIVLTGARGSGASAIVQGDVAYVSTGGDADFSAFPYKLLASGRVTKVDLKNKRVLLQRTLPTNSYGAATRLGGDGALYVSLYEDLSSFTDRIVKLRADDLTPVATGASAWLSLTGADGKATTCANGVADALGRLHCLVSGAASATSVVVFDVTGKEVRRVAAGQGGVDLALR